MATATRVILIKQFNQQNTGKLQYLDVFCAVQEPGVQQPRALPLTLPNLKVDVRLRYSSTAVHVTDSTICFQAAQAWGPRCKHDRTYKAVHTVRYV